MMVLSDADDEHGHVVSMIMVFSDKKGDYNNNDNRKNVTIATVVVMLMLMITFMWFDDDFNVNDDLSL